MGTPMEVTPEPAQEAPQPEYKPEEAKKPFIKINLD